MTETGERKTLRGLRLRYVIGMGAIACLVTASWVTLQTVISQQEHFAQLISTASHQESNAERIVLSALSMSVATDEDEYAVARSQLGRAIHRLGAAHKALLNGDPDAGLPKVMSPTLEIIYFDNANGVDPAVTRYLERAREVYEAPFGELAPTTSSFVYLQQYGPHVMTALFDSALDEYQRIADASITRVQNVETGLWIAALIALVIEVLIIFRPMERRVKDAFVKLREKNDDLEKTVVELVSAQTRLQASEEKFRAMAANVPGIIFQMREHRNGERNYLYVSPRARELCGVSPEEILDDWKKLNLHPEDAERFVSTIREAFENQSEWHFEGRLLTPEGEERWCRGISKPTAVNDEEVLFNGLMVDITTQKELEERLRDLATTDPLTGALNRRHFLSITEKELTRSSRHGHPVSVMMLDIDHFKKINDTYGHAGGDQALIKTVRTIKERLREADVFGRLGGEEFAIVLPETTPFGAASLAERVRNAIAMMTVESDAGDIRFTMSIGIAVAQPGETSIEAALERADEALYQAKSDGRNRVVVHHSADAAPPNDYDAATSRRTRTVPMAD